MKKFSLTFLICFMIHFLFAQVFYYKAEWSMKDKHDLFTGICKIEIKDNEMVKGELVWKFLAVDSTDNSMMDMYKGKKGKSGIEFVEGNYNPSTHDIFFEGQEKDDPCEILGLDKYSLKRSADGLVLYGTTATGGTNKGLFYAHKLKAVEGVMEFKTAKLKVSKK